MTKLSVSVDVPAIGRKHEFLVPGGMLVKDVIVLMARVLASEYGVLSDTSDLMLFDKKDGEVLGMDCDFLQLGIFDGTKLVLI